MPEASHSVPQQGADHLLRATDSTIDDRRFLRTFLVAFIAAALLIAAINFVVDPTDVFHTGLFPPVTWVDRDEKSVFFTQMQPKPQLLILGSSRMMKMNPACATSLSGLKTFNFAVNDARAEDYVAILGFVSDHGGAPKRILIGIDSEGLSNAPFDWRLANSKYLSRYLPVRPSKFSHLGENLLSRIQLAASMSSVRHVLTHQTETIRVGPDGYLTYIDLEAAKSRGTFDLRREIRVSITGYATSFEHFDGLSPVRVAMLHDFFTQCHAKGIQVDAVIPPLHPDVLAAMERTPVRARIADTARMLRQFEAEGLLHYIDVTTIDRFGGDPDRFFDGIHMEEWNSSRILEHVYGGRCAVQ